MHPFINVTLQQTKGDCGIAAFAMLTGQSYGDVFAAAVTPTFKRPHTSGMMTRQLVALGLKFGLTLRLLRTWDEETACGLLTVEKLRPEPGEFLQHLVLLKWGLVFDTDASVWEPDVYYEQHGFKPVTLLVIQEKL